MMKLRINLVVAEDLKTIKKFIAEDNADKALETVQEIYRQFENIQQFPYIGADLSKRVSFKTDYKYVVWNDYVVLYKVAKEAVGIYRVVNRYQDITKLFSQLIAKYYDIPAMKPHKRATKPYQNDIIFKEKAM